MGVVVYYMLWCSVSGVGSSIHVPHGCIDGESMFGTDREWLHCVSLPCRVLQPLHTSLQLLVPPLCAIVDRAVAVSQSPTGAPASTSSDAGNSNKVVPLARGSGLLTFYTTKLRGLVTFAAAVVKRSADERVSARGGGGGATPEFDAAGSTLLLDILGRSRVSSQLLDVLPKATVLLSAAGLELKYLYLHMLRAHVAAMEAARADDQGAEGASRDGTHVQEQ